MAARNPYPSGTKASGPPGRPASGSWAKTKRAYSQGSQNSPNETPLPPSHIENPSMYGQTGHPSTLGQTGNPAWNARTRPSSQGANTRTPSQDFNTETPSQYARNKTPSHNSSQGSYNGTPSQYAPNNGAPSQYPNTGTPSQYASNTRTPSQSANAGAPSQYANNRTPSQYANTGAPSQYGNAGAPSQYARNGNRSHDSSQDSYAGTPPQFARTGPPSQYANAGAPSQYARHDTSSQDSSQDSYTGTPPQYARTGPPSQYANTRTPSQDSYDGTPSQFARTGTPSQDSKPTITSQVSKLSIPSQDAKTPIPSQDTKTTIPSRDAKIALHDDKIALASEDDKTRLAAQYAKPVAYKPSASSLKVRMVTQPYSASSSVYGNYRSRHSVSLGALQITVGIMSIIFNIVGLFIQGELQKLLRFASSEFPYYVYRGENFMFHMGYGFWCAFFYIVAGCCAIAAGRSRTRCTIITSMVVSILAALFSWAQIPMAAASIGIDASIPRETYQQVYYPQEGIPKMRYTDEQWAHIQSSLAMACMLLAMGILEFVFALWSSILACRVTCGRKAVRAPMATVTANTGVVYAADSAPGVPQFAPNPSRPSSEAGVESAPGVTQYGPYPSRQSSVAGVDSDRGVPQYAPYPSGQSSIAGVAATGPPALSYGRLDPNASSSTSSMQVYSPNTAPSFGEDCEVSTPHVSAAYEGFNIL